MALRNVTKLGRETNDHQRHFRVYAGFSGEFAPAARFFRHAQPAEWIANLRMFALGIARPRIGLRAVCRILLSNTRKPA
jgi:hypothetical protein